MSDAIQKVQRGQDLRIPAAAYNAFVDAALDLRRRQHQQSRTAQPQHRSSGLVKVKNDSGQDQNRFAVLGVDGPIFTPDSQGNLESFKNQIALVSVVPSLADHQGRFVILAEPLKGGAIGWAWAAGVCPVQIQIDDENHRCAEATSIAQEIAALDRMTVKELRARHIEVFGEATRSGHKAYLAIFDAFDRFDEHMYEFQIGGKGPMDRKAKRYVLSGAMNNPLDDKKAAGDVTHTTLGSLGLKVDEPFGYWFDFGDDWWHQITVRAIHDPAPSGRYPKVTQKIGQSPPQYMDQDENEGDDDEREVEGAAGP